MIFGLSQKMQAVNDCCHAETIAEGGVTVNMSLGVSAKHLYDVCVKEAKNNCSMNYTGHLKVRYMEQ